MQVRVLPRPPKFFERNYMPTKKKSRGRLEIAADIFNVFEQKLAKRKEKQLLVPLIAEMEKFEVRAANGTKSKLSASLNYRNCAHIMRFGTVEGAENVPLALRTRAKDTIQTNQSF